MTKTIESITIFSQNAEKLANFYNRVLDLPISQIAALGENGEQMFLLETCGSLFSIVDHSRVKGKNREPERFIINFEVTDIFKEAENLEQKSVKKIQDIYHVESYGLIATFEDIDGNYFQIVQVRPLAAKKNLKEKNIFMPLN